MLLASPSHVMLPITSLSSAFSSSSSSSSSSQLPAMMTFDQVLDNVEARFLYNLPLNEIENVERLFFQIEQAYWYYEDFFADKYDYLPHFSSLKSFAIQIFKHCDLLKKVEDKFNELFKGFRNYKSKIPVYGCIMLNPKMNKVVLVCDYNGKSWTFPRGKVNENESELACACREVYEETGYDCTSHIKDESDHLISFMDEKQIKLFIATNISEDTEFTILTRKEISKISFFNIDNLPKTYHVLPFIEKLKRWIKLQNKKYIILNKSPKLVNINNNNNNNYNNNILKSPSRGTTKTSTSTTNTSYDNSNDRISNESINNLVNKIKSPSRNNIKNKINNDKINNNDSNTVSSPFISNINSIIDLHNGTINTNYNNNNNNQNENENVDKYINDDKSSSHQHQQSHQQQYHGNVFDQRNDDTFELSLSNSSHKKGWNVNDMFQTNAKLTGRDYTDYDGNPHQFGSSHPRYVNYSSLSKQNNIEIDNKNNNNNNNNNNSDDLNDNFLLELSQQSQINDHMLRLEKNNLLTTSIIENNNNNEYKSKYHNQKSKTTLTGLESFLETNFALPKSAFSFDHVQAVINQNHTRENSFDETKNIVKGSINQDDKNNNNNSSSSSSRSSSSESVSANGKYITLTFKFDRERIMEVVDQILNK